MLPVKIALMVLAVVTCCTAAAAQGNIITTIVDYLGCRRTRNYGFAGQCVRRSCCRSSASVNGLCLNSQYTCCYGEDVCEEERFHALQGSRRPGYPPNRRPGDRYRKCDTTITTTVVRLLSKKINKFLKTLFCERQMVMKETLFVWSP